MRTRPAGLEEVVAALRAGGLAVFPTETLWSLSCRADDRAAVRHVFAVKRRPGGVPLALGLPSWAAARDLVEVTPGAEALAHRFLPGPLSLVLHRLDGRFAHLAPQASTLSLRVPSQGAAQDILRLVGPVVMTSANRHGEPDPRMADAVMAALDDAFPLGEIAVLVPGDVPGKGSTVVDATGPQPRVIREGVIPAEEVKAAWP